MYVEGVDAVVTKKTARAFDCTDTKDIGAADKSVDAIVKSTVL